MYQESKTQFMSINKIDLESLLKKCLNIEELYFGKNADIEVLSLIRRYCHYIKSLKLINKTLIHLITIIDLFSTVGANSECDESVCCRSTSFGNNHSAGQWSEVIGTCDTNTYFVADAVKQMSCQHKDQIDFIT